MYTATSYNFDFDKRKQVVLTDVLNNQAKIEKAKNYIFSYINEHPEQFYSDLKRAISAWMNTRLSIIQAAEFQLYFSSMISPRMRPEIRK